MDAKTFIIPEGSNGLDPNLLLNGSMGNWGNNPLWALIFLAFIGRGGLWGNDNNQLNAIQEQLNTNHGQTLLMDAIKGNAGSIHELATTIGCNHNAVTAAVNGVQAAIANLGNQYGMGNAQVINAINNGNMTLANTLQSCCCDVKQLVTTQGYENRINNIEQSNMITKGFGDIAYATQSQTTALAANNDANTRAVLAKLDQIEDSRKDREISALTAALANATAKAERQAELAPLYDAIKDVQCKQPATVTLPYSCATAIPTSLAWQTAYGAYSPWGGQFG